MSKKKTHEEYVSELAIKNPNLQVIEEYVNTQTKITHRCLLHNVEWKITPSNALSGAGCELCRREKLHNFHQKTMSQYIDKLKKINQDIIVLEDYVDSHTPILHKCLKHNIEWNIAPSNALQGNGCSQCKSEKIRKKLRKTHEEYILELNNINSNITVLDQYIDSNTPILHKCLKDGYEWKAQPSNLLNGYGCPKCSFRFNRNHSDYVNEVTNSNPNIQVIGDFIDMRTPILHKCLKHNIEWNIAPDNILRGHGCRKCGFEKIREKLVKPHNYYIKEVRKIDKNIVVLDDYINAYTPILHKCLKDGYEWKTAPSNILSGCGCPKCAGNLKRTHRDYIDQVSSIHPNIEVIDKYISASIPILHKCIIHQYEWYAPPYSILSGTGCMKCGREKTRLALTKSHNQYVSELQKINKNIIVLETYQNSHTPILHKCLVHNYNWYAKPVNLLKACGCPKCSESKGEKKIRLWLEEHHIEYKFQKRFDDCKDKYTLPFDFYLPQHHSVIEYNGEQHYKSIDFFGGDEYFEYIKFHDKIKKEYATNNNIRYLAIPYNKDIEEELNNFLFI